MITAYGMIHYGAEYLHYALESIVNQVNHIVILYSAKPSQGHGTSMICPDTREDLKKICEQFKYKLTWIDGEWHQEGEHHNAIFGVEAAQKSEFLWRFDQDEISPPGMVEEMIRQAKETDGGLFQVPFVHFWRNFNTVCRDGQYPYRLIRMNNSDKSVILDRGDKNQWQVYHFGYAQSTKYIQYKWSVIGHKPELRPDWFKEKWSKNAQEDVHPVSIGLWEKTSPFDKHQLPKILHTHPYFDLDLIK